MATGRLGVGETLEALNAAVGPGSPVWFKETHARHLRVRDFLAPRSALQARFRDGQVGARRSGTSRRIHGTTVHLHTHLPAGARVRVACGLLPAGSRGGPCTALRADTRGFIAPTTAARSLRTCTRCPGLLCYSRQTRLTRPASCPTLPSTAL